MFGLGVGVVELPMIPLEAELTPATITGSSESNAIPIFFGAVVALAGGDLGAGLIKLGISLPIAGLSLEKWSLNEDICVLMFSS